MLNCLHGLFLVWLDAGTGLCLGPITGEHHQVAIPMKLRGLPILYMWWFVLLVIRAHIHRAASQAISRSSCYPCTYTHEELV
jgi:hypothetical protein